MTDPQVEPSLTTRKKKKSKKKKSAKVEPGAIQNGEMEKTPKQTSAAEDEVITTSKCQRCKGVFKLMVSKSDATPVSQSTPWMCHNCMQTIRSEEKGVPSSGGVVKTQKEVPSAPGGCNCSACVTKRENVCTPESERDAQATQTYWMDVRHVVRRIYRDSTNLSSKENRAVIGSDKMVAIVKILCTKDPHQFFQRLETLAREYLLEVKVRLLEQLSCGFNSPQLAIEFVQMLLDEYSTMCSALPSLLYLLEPLEEADFIPKLGMTIELMNKNIFRELIFAESFMSLNLPLIVAQLRLACLSSDPYHRSTADALSHRYLSLDKEMEEVNRIWRTAKDRLNGFEPKDHHHHSEEEKRSHMEKVRTEAEAFKLMKQTSDKAMELSNHQYMDTAKTRPHTHTSHSKSLRQQDKHTDTSAPPPSSKSPSSQLTEWSKLLFKCIKPIGDPDFRLNGDIATHTITLKLDMTELDLSAPNSSRHLCSKDDLRRYRKLGLTPDEVVEVAMKLNALKALGINLRIEDLFDEEGLLLADNQDLLRAGGGGEESVGDDVYFLDDKGTGGGSDGVEGDHFTEQELADLEKAKDLILKRQEAENGRSQAENGRSRQNDFLQSMTMKIRFMKRLTSDDLERNEGGKIIFNSCDQVQMKLTQLELNSVRLLTSPDSVTIEGGGGSDTIHIPANFSDTLVQEDYALIHPDGHKEFMDLLFEKRRLLDEMPAKPPKALVVDHHSEHHGNHSEHHGNHSDHQHQSHNGQRCRGNHDDVKSDSVDHRDQRIIKTSGAHAKHPAFRGGGGGGGFKPVYFNGCTQPCYCSACIGAMAAAYCSDYMSRPLNPTDPTFGSASIEMSLFSQLNGDGEEEDKTSSMMDIARFGEEGRSKPTTGAINKEGLWHNWMVSTPDPVPVPAECSPHLEPAYPPSSSSSSSSPIPRCSHQSTNHCSSVDPVDLVCSESTRSSLSAGSCEHEFHTVHTTATATQTGSSTNTLNSTTDPPKRYCPCCYCELFGHNVPPTAPVSHNFTKQRDKMRLKLEKKKKESESVVQWNHHHCSRHQEHLSHTNGCISCDASEDRSLDELLAFIEGMEGGISGQGSPRAAKKQKKKHKKAADTSKPSEQLHDMGVLAQDISSSQLLMETLVLEGVGGLEVRNGSEENTSRERQHKSVKADKPPNQKTSIGSRVEQLPSAPVVPLRAHLSEDIDAVTSGAGDEEDEELEAFKKFCFSTTPANNRKKLAVNVREVMAKIK